MDLGDPRALVLDDDAGLRIVPLDPHHRPIAVAGRVLQQVAQRPAQRRGPARHQNPARVLEAISWPNSERPPAMLSRNA